MRNKRLRAEIPSIDKILEMKLQLKDMKPSDTLRDVLDDDTFDVFKNEINKKGLA